MRGALLAVLLALLCSGLPAAGLKHYPRADACKTWPSPSQVQRVEPTFDPPTASSDQAAAEDALLLTLGLLDATPHQHHRTAVARRKMAEVDHMLHSWPHLLPADMLRRSIAGLGDPTRLQAAMSKLLSGQPIRVATVGGSVTMGSGAPDPLLHSYVSRLFAFIEHAFPHAKHQLRNVAISGATSMYYSQCVEEYLPQGVDLVFLEFTLNDMVRGGTHSDMDSDLRRGFEILVRKLLQLEGDPAIVVLHWWSPKVSNYTFWKSAEDQMETIAQYYGLPSLSWRNMMYHSVMAEKPGLRFGQVYCDAIHPGYLGHRYLADMVVNFLQAAVVSTIVHPLTSRSTDGSTAASELPPPMLEGNWEGQSTCLRGSAFKSMVVEVDGWQWVDEGKPAAPKWGYVTSTPGATLLIRVNTTTVFMPGKEKVLIGVGILKSYEHMGIAQLECISGCSCTPTKLDGHHEQPTSLETWVNLSVSQADNCTLKVTNSWQTNSGEHKIRVSSVFVSDISGTNAKYFNSVRGYWNKAKTRRQWDERQALNSTHD